MNQTLKEQKVQMQKRYQKENNDLKNENFRLENKSKELQDELSVLKKSKDVIVNDLSHKLELIASESDEDRKSINLKWSSILEEEKKK